MEPLYSHTEHPHTARNVNLLHAFELKSSGFNQRFAVTLTKTVSSMWAAYLFAVLALLGLFGLLGWLSPFVFLLTTWISQQFLQLVFLPILAVGQDVLSRHQELQAEETYQTTMKIFHESEQMRLHMDAQDQEILALKNLLVVLVQKGV